MDENRIEIIDGDKITLVKAIPGVGIKFKGKNSVVRFKKPLPKINKCKFELGDNCLISFEPSTRYIVGLVIEANGMNATATFGRNFSCFHTRIFLTNEKDLSVTVGDYCIFAFQTIIRATDAHCIIDKETGKVVNHGKSVIIGNHVWIAHHSYILKGVNLKDWTVVGARSLVSKSVDESHCVIAGSPAKILRRNILWDYRDPYLMEHPKVLDENVRKLFEVPLPSSYQELETLYHGDIFIKESSSIWNAYILPLIDKLEPNSYYLVSLDDSKVIKGDYIFYQLAFKDLNINLPHIFKNIIVGCKYVMAFKTTDIVPPLEIKFYSGETGNCSNQSLEIKNVKFIKINILE